MQNYKNHIRYYPPHHFVFYPVMTLLLGLSVRFVYSPPSQHWVWVFIALGLLAIILLALMLRQHYALTVQNRIVRLELRFRYYVLTQQRFEPLELSLTQGQLFALRFASDEELPPLVQRALREGLSPDAIKRAIVNWLPDTMRV